jgi:hypothetical protein
MVMGSVMVGIVTVGQVSVGYVTVGSSATIRIWEASFTNRNGLWTSCENTMRTL